MRDRVVCPLCSGSGDVDERDKAFDERHGGNDRDLPSSGDDRRTPYEVATRELVEVSSPEDETTWSRLEAAEERDRAAEVRDRGAEGRDLQARMREVRHDDNAAAENILLRAGRDRAKAADDRAKAAADRTEAAAEREQAAHDRSAALHAQAHARHDAEHNLMRAASDELTGALTRQFGLLGVSNEIDRAGRSGGGLVLAAIDLDRLDEAKRTLGQAAANRLLRFVGDSLKANIRSYDLIVRYQEAAFLCVMPGITRAAATNRLTTVAAVLTAADKQHAITFGVAEYQPADELQDLLGRADQDLLAARRASGRE